MPLADALLGRVRKRRGEHQLLAAVLECVGVAVVAFGPDGRVTHASTATLALVESDCAVGSGPEAWIRALLPRTPSGLPLAAEDLPPLRALQGEVVSDFDVLVRVGDRELLLGTQARPVTDERGRRLGAVAVLRDVTPQRRREAELRAAGPQRTGADGSHT